MKRTIIVLALIAAGSLAAAEEPVEDLPQPPPIPEPVRSGEALEPEVTIIETDKGTVQEYRVNGHLYMVKIQPMKGPAYYMMDTNGDGILDAREDKPYNTGVPQWVLFSWD